VFLKAFDPESKGIVERSNRYLETSFKSGRAVASPIDFNTQLTDWLALPNTRRVRRIAGHPVEAIATDRAAMTPLAAIAPVIRGFVNGLGWTVTITCGWGSMATRWIYGSSVVSWTSTLTSIT